ncbi:linoleate 13S-lipoxygenase 3-1, chloroplastic-like protein [Tanacetum coccineum]
MGHADMCYENWWPTLVNAEDLTAILTTIIWLASAQHAALNFVVDTLSTHSPDEEYICKRQQRNTWSGDAEMVEAFYGFALEIQRIEKEIEKQNRDMSLKNRRMSLSGIWVIGRGSSYYPVDNRVVAVRNVDILPRCPMFCLLLLLIMILAELRSSYSLRPCAGYTSCGAVYAWSFVDTMRYHVPHSSVSSVRAEDVTRLKSA